MGARAAVTAGCQPFFAGVAAAAGMENMVMVFVRSLAADSDMMPKRDHEKDLELDKKIEALRRKNEALMKRYKEVEEDRRRAEEEGMALQSRKGKADDLTITISKSTNDNRVVVTKPFSGGSPAGKGQQEAGLDKGGDGPAQGGGRGHRKQLMVTMAGKKGKRVVSERPEKRPGPADVRSPTHDGQPSQRGRQPPHPTRRDTAQEETKQGQKLSEEPRETSEQLQEPENQEASTDLNVPTSKEEQEEYLRWKKEREQIDRERVARHKNAKGQWRRAWDMDKTENMFPDKSPSDKDWGPSSRGGRNPRRGQQKAGSDSRGHDKRGKDKAAKNVLVMGSKAKGKDRLTGRARRWQPNDDEGNPQTFNATLEEFLEDLEALTEAEGDDLKDQDSKEKASPSPDSLSASEELSGSAALVSAESLREDTLAQGKAEAMSPRGSEKKVRFSEEIVQNVPVGQDSFKASSPKNNKREARVSVGEDGGCSQANGGAPPTGPVTPPPEAPETDRDPAPAPSAPPAAETASASPPQMPVQPAELAKCNISNANAEELIDSGLSVLSLESGEPHPAHSTSSDKARENGKIV
ncbi:coiled-coil domain-containing protein 9B isoform 1-T1 [Menidia menidia]